MTSSIWSTVSPFNSKLWTAGSSGHSMLLFSHAYPYVLFSWFSSLAYNFFQTSLSSPSFSEFYGNYQVWIGRTQIISRVPCQPANSYCTWSARVSLDVVELRNTFGTSWLYKQLLAMVFKVHNNYLSDILHTLACNLNKCVTEIEVSWSPDFYCVTANFKTAVTANSELYLGNSGWQTDHVLYKRVNALQVDHVLLYLPIQFKAKLDWYYIFSYYLGM